jgi:hypothetical protein
MNIDVLHFLPDIISSCSNEQQRKETIMYQDRESVEEARDLFYAGDIEAGEFIAIAELWDGDLAELL